LSGPNAKKIGKATVVEFVADRRHLPVITFRRAAQRCSCFHVVTAFAVRAKHVFVLAKRRTSAQSQRSR